MEQTYVFMTDSDSDLLYSIADERHIPVVKMPYILDGKEYFDDKAWNIITLIENERLTQHKGHPFHQKDHKHKVGHVFAQKKNNRLRHNYTYKIKSIF